MTTQIEPLVTQLVQSAPALDPAVVADLRAALAATAVAAAADAAPTASVTRGLALAISRIVEYVAEGLVDPGIALPALAEACATLVSSRDAAVLAAAHYQIDTLEPMPDPVPGVTDRSSAALGAAVDVPVTNLVPRRRT